jgi:RimK family alpha-L-glutamate ligase
MQGWILYKRNTHELTPNDHGINRLCEAAAQQGIELVVYRPEQFDVVVGAGIYIDGRPTRLPDFLLPRLGAETTYLAFSIIRYLELQGVVTCNSSSAVEGVKDKLLMSQRFVAAGLPSPRTMLIKNPICLDFIVHEFGLPVVIKTISGARGGGVYLCSTLADLRKLLTSLTTEVQAHGLIAQQFMSSSYGSDLRVFVVGEQIVGCMQRTALDGFKANYSLGGRVESYPVNDEIAYLAFAATRLFGLEITGIDLLFTPTGFSLCEANSSPGFKGMELASGVDIARKIIDYVQTKVKAVTTL